MLRRAVAEGRAPDLALLDSVWIPEFAHAGFLLPLEEVDPDWVSRRARARLPAGGAVGEPARGAHLRRLGLRRCRRALVPARRARLRRLRRRPRRGTSCGRRRARSPPDGGRADRAAGRLAGCRDDVVLPRRPARVERRGGDRRRPRHDRLARDCGGARVRAQPDRRRPDAAGVAGYAWDRPVRLLAAGRAALSFGGSYEARTLAQELDVPLAGGLRPLSASSRFRPARGGRRPRRPGRWSTRSRARRPGRARDAAAARARRACARGRGRARHRPHPRAPLRRRARRAGAAVPRADGRDARARGQPPGHPRLPARLGAATGDARVGALRARRAGRRRPPRGRPDRRDHRASGGAGE